MLRKGKNAPEIHPYHQVIHDFGWSATLALDWMSQSVGSSPGHDRQQQDQTLGVG